ncbi:uncharacterized protein C2orf81 homolog isoform X2 [Corvus cornix cornix]|uniref:uncharacterized protein C2orf81 homolog isoform X2 n=1 Tax=Corvus cornix cornix TaxID=932674 RepID=UPI001950F438|nr:uncharacterized protein C2orf81 homolog isoform X2 [Corvus cornix cornix]
METRRGVMMSRRAARGDYVTLPWSLGRRRGGMAEKAKPRGAGTKSRRDKSRTLVRSQPRQGKKTSSKSPGRTAAQLTPPDDGGESPPEPLDTGPILDDLLDRVMSECALAAAARQRVSFTVSRARDAILFVAEWRFQVRDDGEPDPEGDPDPERDGVWKEDEEPETCTWDSWIAGVPPIVSRPSEQVPSEDVPVIAEAEGPPECPGEVPDAVPVRLSTLCPRTRFTMRSRRARSPPQPPKLLPLRSPTLSPSRPCQGHPARSRPSLPGPPGRASASPGPRDPGRPRRARPGPRLRSRPSPRNRQRRDRRGPWRPRRRTAASATAAILLPHPPGIDPAAQTLRRQGGAQAGCPPRCRSLGRPRGERGGPDDRGGSDAAGSLAGPATPVGVPAGPPGTRAAAQGRAAAVSPLAGLGSAGARCHRALGRQRAARAGRGGARPSGGRGAEGGGGGEES